MIGHDYIGTEHILLGLLREQEGVAGRVLQGLGITIESARAQILGIVPAGEKTASGQIPFTPRVKRVFELSLNEAIGLAHNYIGTEHILLGLVRENGGVAARVLSASGADTEKIRREALRLLSRPDVGGVKPQPRVPRAVDASVHVRPTAGLQRMLMRAAARSLDAGRSEIELEDLLVALTLDDETAPLLGQFGLSEDAMRAAIESQAASSGPEGEGSK